MFQTKVFQGVSNLESMLNKWLEENKDIDLIDIKYFPTVKNAGSFNPGIWSSALIIYKKARG
jgi:hypothetical protein